MLDLLLIPAALLLVLALRAVRRGNHHLHGYLMVAAFTVGALRMFLRPRALPTPYQEAALVLSGLIAATMLLGWLALAWREGRSHRNRAPRIHRSVGVLTLIALAMPLAIWLLRDRG